MSTWAPTMLLGGTLACVATATPTASAEIDPHGGMLRYPDVGNDRIVFVYANDLWTVDRKGGQAEPLASPPGGELFPKFSPDGETIAFVGNYDGGRDLYTIPVGGGIPVRVTHHPSGEVLCDWTPDGGLLFYTNGMSGLGRAPKLFTVGADGGLPVSTPVPYGAAGAISPDGTWLAYTPHTRDSRTWKRYRGGMASDIWLFNLETHESRKITDWEGTDTLPMWHGKDLYYLSDNGGEEKLNIWKYSVGAGRHEQVTHYDEHDVKWPSIGPGRNGRGEIVFQNGPDLVLLDLRNDKARTVDVTIPGARPTIRTRRVNAMEFLQAADISATGKRAVAQARGDIWTLPAENGSVRNLTRTSGAAERSPSWSPDGRWIAYFSDATGEYELYITQSDGKGETKQITSGSKTFYFDSSWSPDSKHIVFTDKAAQLHLHSIESEETKVIDQDPWGNPPNVSWSHDSGWLAYARTDDRRPSAAIHLYNLETGERHQVTSGMFGDAAPTFDRKGDYLYFGSSRQFSPSYSDVDLSFIYDESQVLIAVPLRADVKSPWLLESDDETWKDEEEDDDEDEADDDDEEGDDDEVDDDDGDDEDGDDEDDGDDEGDDDGDDEGDDDDEEDDGDGDDEGDDEGDDKGDDEDDDADAVPTSPIHGIWEGTVSGLAAVGLPPEMDSVEFRMTIVVHADGSITGTSEAMGESDEFDEITFDESTGEFFTKDSDEGITSIMKGKLDGNTLSGTWEIPDMGVSGSWEATKSDETIDAEDAAADKDKDKPAEKVEIDLDGFEARAFMLPVPNGNFGQLAVNDKNQLIYTRMGDPAPSIKLFDLKDKKKEEKTVAGGAAGFAISGDGKKLLVLRGQNGSIQNAAAGASGKPIKTTGMTVDVDPRAEWRQIFLDAWRIQRDFFYVENMHGVDWEAMRDKYLAMIDECVSREDVSYVIGELIGELNVGHAYYFGGDGESQSFTNVGLLGVDWSLENGAYRIAEVVQGAAWDVDARSPLSAGGLDINVGDYVLAVNGVPVDVTKDPWAAFVGTAGQEITLTVSTEPEMTDAARDVVIKPIGGERRLRYRAWIERNRAHVDEQTDGQVGYIYVPDTGVNGQNDLVRQYFGQLDKKALIIDERWNGGGQIPTRFIEMLNRPVTNYWARRDNKDWTWPPDAHRGPKCMLINGLAGSGGDMFPWLFRYNKLGKIIGTRTWGGLVGLSGNPRLIDGGYTAVPTFGFYEVDGTWGIEGHGVDPDIEVIDDPAKMVDGGDPQLDAAIALMLEEIKSNPHTPPARPTAPVRTGIGIEEKDK